MAPFADVPRRTAGGVGALDDDGGGTGTMPKACSVGSDETGSCTGMAVDIPAADSAGVGTDVSEAGVNGDVVVGVEVEPLAKVVAVVVAVDSDLVVGIAVARACGTYWVMVELSGTE